MKLALPLVLASGCGLLVAVLAGARPPASNTFVREPIVVYDFSDVPNPILLGNTSLIVYNDGHVVYVQLPGVAPGSQTIAVSKVVPPAAALGLARQLYTLGVSEFEDTVAPPDASQVHTLSVLGPYTDASVHTFSWNGFLENLIIHVYISAFLNQYVLPPQ